MDYTQVTQGGLAPTNTVKVETEAPKVPAPQTPQVEAPKVEGEVNETPAPKPDGNETLPVEGEEPSKVEAKEEPREEKKDPFAPRFAALSKRDKELRALEKELKERSERVSKLEEAISKAKEDPDGLFQAAGITYEDVVSHYLKGDKAPQDHKLKTIEEKLNALEQEKLEQKKQSEQQAQQQKIDAFHQRIDSFVKEHGEQYELTKHFVSPEDVYNEMVAHYQRTEAEKGYGETLTIAQAVEGIEKRLESEILTKSKESSKIKKLLGQILQPEAGENPAPKQSETPKAVSGGMTLSNQRLSDRPVGQSRRLSRDESIRELAKKLEFYE